MCQTETKPEVMTDANGFEIKTCGRCGGCGRYSYCTMYGDRCFGCGGTGKVYTKRGAAAKAFLDASLMVRADEIKVGDAIKTWHGGKFSKVLNVGPQTDGGGAIVNGELVPGYVLETAACHYVVTGPADLVRKAWNAADKAPKLAAALAYQATLLQTGKPSKRKLAKAG